MVMESRRRFLQGTIATAGMLALSGIGASAASFPKSPNGKTLAGVFPIGWTVCTPDNKLNLDAMAKQMHFLNQGRVAGMAWPQNASAWQTLSSSEWNAGAEALASVKGKSALLLGVQTHEFNIANSQERARAAKRLGVDGVVSIIPHESNEKIITYFKALAAASDLPVVAQAIGDTSVDTIIALFRAVPSLAAIKYEVANPMEHAGALLKRSGGKLEVFSGFGGHTFFPEMELGFTGTCPYVGMSDVLQSCFNQYQAGNKDKAFQTFGAFLAFNSIPRSNDYVLKARGVFPENALMRVTPDSKAHYNDPITEAQKAEIRKALATYMKPYLVA